MKSSSLPQTELFVNGSSHTSESSPQPTAQETNSPHLNFPDSPEASKKRFFQFWGQNQGALKAFEAATAEPPELITEAEMEELFIIRVRMKRIQSDMKRNETKATRFEESLTD